MRKINEIIAELEDAIIRGEWYVGMRLPSEAMLCKKYGASRTVIREALEQLRGRQLIETIKGSGSYVKEFSGENLAKSLGTYSAMATDRTTLIELLELRQLIEADAAKRLAISQNQESIEAMDETVAEMRSTRDIQKLTQADTEFHRLLVESSGNKLFSVIFSALRSSYVALGRNLYSTDERALQSVISQHAAIVAAIRNSNPEGAADALRNHLKLTRDRIA